MEGNPDGYSHGLDMQRLLSCGEELVEPNFGWVSRGLLPLVFRFHDPMQVTEAKESV